jgi:hypothetical protein
MRIIVEYDHLNESGLKDIWLKYLRSRLFNTRVDFVRKIRAGFFCSDLKYVRDNTTAQEDNMFCLFGLAMVKLQHKIGQNNPSTRRLVSFKKEYLKEIDTIFKEYHYGILSKSFPPCYSTSSKHWDEGRVSLLNKLDYIRRQETKDYWLLFYINWSGKNIDNMVKKQFRPVARALRLKNFDLYKRLLYDYQSRKNNGRDVFI